MADARTRTISPVPATTGGDDVAYPKALRDAERERIARRRTAVEREVGIGNRVVEVDPASIDPASVVGVGVSGGGIRSATFALGVFQALARARLVQRIDVLSTVSGGGYFGGFLGRLLTRAEVEDVADGERVLTGEHPVIRDRAVRSLRENGRYLSPNGSGDLVVGGAVLLRNWVALHVVLLTSVLAVFVALQALRLAAVGIGGAPAEAFELPASAVWWSPWLWLPAACFALVCVPFGWAYWFIEPRIRGQLVGLACVLGAAAVSAVARSHAAPGCSIAVEIAVAASVGLALMTWRIATRRGAAEGGNAEAARGRARTFLSHGLAKALTVFAALLVVALVDTAGGTLVRRAAVEQTSPFGAWWGGIGAAFVAVSGLGRRIVVAIGGKGGGGARLHVGVATLAGVAALAVGGALLVAVDMVSHQVAAISIRGADFVGIPAAPPAERVPRTIVLDGPTPWDRATLEVACPGGCAVGAPAAPVVVGWREALPSVLAAGLLFLLSAAFGRTWSFLNRSSHHALYSARIGRAYLGASNPERWRDGIAVTEMRRADDCPLRAYYHRDVTAKGAPLHLVNVTINETTEGTSNVAQQDRHGLAMAVGPCGLSVSVADHAVLDWDKPKEARILPEIPPAADPTQEPAARRLRSLRAFGDGLTLAFGPDVRPLSEWIGASGAAFSTGLGARTSLGTSFLAGIGNVRLGHWWFSGVRRDDPTVAARQHAGGPWRWFGVQGFLLAELTAQFPGTARARWYLSDGGHFENLGGYELIRRGLERIVLVDAEADPDFTFEGLSNLVRKARIDFHAEIRFLGRDEVHRLVPAAYRGLLGGLADLARDGKSGPPATDASEQKPSLAHAALAEVRYADGRVGWLLYVKATVLADVPTDVLRYQGAHPAFPHESTADQFFDEAQWESYRRLGEHIGSRLFPAPSPDAPSSDAPATRPAGGPWVPRDLFGGSPPAVTRPSGSTPPPRIA